MLLTNVRAAGPPVWLLIMEMLKKKNRRRRRKKEEKSTRFMKTSTSTIAAADLGPRSAIIGPLRCTNSRQYKRNNRQISRHARPTFLFFLSVGRF